MRHDRHRAAVGGHRDVCEHVSRPTGEPGRHTPALSCGIVVEQPSATPAKGPEPYRFPRDGRSLQSWSSVEDRLRNARFYWLATQHPSGHPHVRPLWGVWVDRALYFDGHPATRWSRNIALSPA